MEARLEKAVGILPLQEGVANQGDAVAVSDFEGGFLGADGGNKHAGERQRHEGSETGTETHGEEGRKEARQPTMAMLESPNHRRAVKTIEHSP